MFVGIVKEVGVVKEIYSDDNGLINGVVISCSKSFVNGVVIGDSISCSGVCLTVVDIGKLFISFDISEETVKKTNFTNVASDSEINLEKSVKIGDGIDGHLVTGHIDGVLKVLKIEKLSNSHLLSFSLTDNLSKFITQKGCVAINGVSLTVNDVLNDRFNVAIIPHTFKNTNFRNLKEGDLVNVEVDLMARYIDSLLNKK